MAEISKKQRELIMLAKKGGNDATLLLLDKINDLEDIVVAFKSIINLVIDIKKQQHEVVTNLEKTYKVLLERTKTDRQTELNNLKDIIKTEHEKMYREHEKMMERIDKRLNELKDGQDADEGKIIKEILAQIKLPKQKEFILDNPEQVRDKLEILKGEQRLGAESISGLDEKFAEIKTMILNIPRGKIGGMRKIPIIKRENLTSQVNGVTTTFGLPRDTVAVLGVFSTQFPITFDTADFSLAGNILTLNTGVVQSGQTLFAIIETLFYG